MLNGKYHTDADLSNMLIVQQYEEAAVVLSRSRVLESVAGMNSQLAHTFIINVHGL